MGKTQEARTLIIALPTKKLILLLFLAVFVQFVGCNSNTSLLPTSNVACHKYIYDVLKVQPGSLRTWGPLSESSLYGTPSTLDLAGAEGITREIALLTTRIDSLHTIYLTDSDVNAEAFEVFALDPSLSLYFLERTRLTMDSLRTLLDNPNLGEVILHGVELTDRDKLELLVRGLMSSGIGTQIKGGEQKET